MTQTEHASPDPFFPSVRTRPKATSEVILATEQGDPLLAWWRYGLGMTVAFTADAKSRWAAEWLTWPGYSRFWAQLVRHTMRRSESQGGQVQVEQRDGAAAVTVDAIDPSGRFLNDAETELVLIDPRLGAQKLPLEPTAPGRYVARFATPLDGGYHLELSQKQNGQVLYRQSRGLTVGYSSELAAWGGRQAQASRAGDDGLNHRTGKHRAPALE